MLQPALCPPLLNLQEQKSSLYLHWGNSSCWGCPHWNSTERAPGHLVNWDILSTATCKEKSWKHVDSKPNYHPFVRSRNHCVVTFHIYAPCTDRKHSSRSKKWVLLTARIFLTTKHNVQIPEHPKSNDFISDFTVAADSGGVGDALLRQTPCQRLAVSDSRESTTSSAVSLQGTNHSKVRANTKCKHRLKVFTDSKTNPTMCRFYCNALNMDHSLNIQVLFLQCLLNY